MPLPPTCSASSPPGAGQFYGAKAAEGFFHEFAGMAVFALAMVLLIAVSTLLKRIRSMKASGAT